MSKSVDGMRKELLGLNLYALSNIEKPIALNALSLLNLVDRLTDERDDLLNTALHNADDLRAMAAEIKRLRDALVYVDENAGNWQTQDNIWPVIAGALKQESKPSDA